MTRTVGRAAAALFLGTWVLAGTGYGQTEPAATPGEHPLKPAIDLAR